MTTGTTYDTFIENAYITVPEYKNAPTSIDYDNLVVGGNANAQDAEPYSALYFRGDAQYGANGKDRSGSHGMGRKGFCGDALYERAACGDGRLCD